MKITDLTQTDSPSDYMPSEVAQRRLKALPKMELVYVFNTILNANRMMTMEECYDQLMSLWNDMPVFLATTSLSGQKVTVKMHGEDEDLIFPILGNTGLAYTEDRYFIMQDECGAYVRKESQNPANRQFVVVWADELMQAASRENYDLILSHVVMHQLLHAMLDADVRQHKYAETCTNNFYRCACSETFCHTENMLVNALALIMLKCTTDERDIILKFIGNQPSQPRMDRMVVRGNQQALINGLDWVIIKQDCRTLQDTIPGNESEKRQKQERIDNLLFKLFANSDNEISFPTAERQYKLMWLTTMALPKGETVLKQGLMEGFCSVEHIDIPEGIEEICQGAFRFCELKEVRFPSSLTKMERGAFIGCSSIEHIYMSGKNDNYVCKNDCFVEKDSGVLVLGCKNSIIYEGVTEIGEQAFEGCYGLTSLSFPASVKVIGKHAFADCIGLTHLYFPATIKRLRFAAFTGCVRLATVIFEGTPELAYQSFAHCIHLMIVKGMSNEKITIDEKAFLHTYPFIKIDFAGDIEYGEKLGIWD